MSEQTKPQAPVAQPTEPQEQLPVPQQDTSAMPSSAKEAWDLLQRKAKAYSRSTMVPKPYQGDAGMGNCILALNLANRLGVDELMVMQNLHIVQGRPGWSSSFLIASINQSGKFSSVRYDVEGAPGKDGYRVRAWAYELATGERLDGTWITWDMVKAEGWLDKPGSKWKTMPEQMAKYRAASFWQRTYAPEIAMGFHIKEELEDIAEARPTGSITISLTKAQMVEHVEAVRGGKDPHELIEELEGRMNAPLPQYQKQQLIAAQHG